MADLSIHLLLDDDERQFIEGLFATQPEANGETARDMWLVVPEHARQLQQLLGRAEAVHIEMQLRHYTLHFHPRLEMHAASGMHELHLGYPDIIEHSGTARGFRLTTGDTEVQATDLSGRLGHLTVANISTSGAALIVAEGDQKLIPGKTRLQLCIRFRHAGSYTVEGVVVRRELHDHKPQLAMKFTRMTAQTKEQLNAYIYEHALDLRKTA